jgi:hypothetical protein
MSEVKCKHLMEGVCLKGLYGGRPSPGICLAHCIEYDGPSRGNGDRVDKVLRAITLGGSKIVKRKCKKCQKRQRRMNRPRKR